MRGLGSFGVALALALPAAVLVGWSAVLTAAHGERAVVATIERGDVVLDPHARRETIVPFAGKLWVPVMDGHVVTLPDAQMGVVGITDTMRVYAPRGGGGGGVVEQPGGWRAGQVYLKVGNGRYWPLEPRARASASP